MDRCRKEMKVSNKEWRSPTHPAARITKMKDGRTRLAYKAEHAVDLETEAIVGTQATLANEGDGQSGLETLVIGQGHLVINRSRAEIQELVADKGYHDNELLSQCAEWEIRTCIPERRQK